MAGANFLRVAILQGCKIADVPGETTRRARSFYLREFLAYIPTGLQAFAMPWIFAHP